MKIISGKINAACAGIMVSAIVLASSAFASVEGRAILPGGIAGPAGAAETSVADASAYCGHGTARFEAGDSRSAIRDFSVAITLDPGHAQAYWGRALAYLALGDNTHAIIDLSMAIAMRPGFARAYYERGRAYYAIGNRFQAARDFGKAAELNPGLASASSKAQ